MEPAPAVPAPASQDAIARTPDWRLIGVFYGVCLAWVSLVALGVYAVASQLTTTAAQITFQFSIAFLYMPAPLAAALIAERVGKRRPLIRDVFSGFGRKLPRLLVSFVVLTVAVYAAFLLFAFVLGNVAHLPGVGTLVTSQDQFDATMATLVPGLGKGGGAEPGVNPAVNMPPIALLYLIAPISGLVAGLSINGLFAFGEEYGWRGFLMDELRPLGAVRANLLTGVLWGLWHAPVILMGYNFGPHRWLGIPMMVVLCTPLAFLWWRARQYTGSLLAPAILHGSFNACGGFFVMLLVGRNPLWSLPVGLLAAVAVGVVAFVFWKFTEGRLAEGAAA